MQFRLTGPEYWLLDLVSVTGHQLARLDSEKDIEIMHNRPSHGLDSRELVATLEGLFKAGLIECTGPDGTLIGAISNAFLRSALDDNRWSYWLTPKGGAAWESFSRPDWTKFIDEESYYETGTCVLTGMSRDRLEHYVSALAIVEYLPDRGSPEIRELGAWQATYWKTLPNGWRATIRRLNAHEPRPWVSHEQHVRDHLLFCGLCHVRDGWHHWP
jgi:hypothetical protein